MTLSSCCSQCSTCKRGTKDHLDYLQIPNLHVPLQHAEYHYQLVDCLAATRATAFSSASFYFLVETVDPASLNGNDRWQRLDVGFVSYAFCDVSFGSLAATCPSMQVDGSASRRRCGMVPRVALKDGQRIGGGTYIPQVSNRTSSHFTFQKHHRIVYCHCGKKEKKTKKNYFFSQVPYLYSVVFWLWSHFIKRLRTSLSG